MREPPRWFVAELQRLDPRLRCRWDRGKACFVIEEYIPRLGYYWHILECRGAAGEPVEPADWVLEYLRQHDHWKRQGGWKAYIHALESRSRRLTEHRERYQRDERVEAMADRITYTGRFADGTKLVV